MAAEWRSEGAPSQCKVVSSLLYIISSWFNIKERRRRIMYAVWQRPSVLAHIPPWWAEGSLAKGGSFVDSSSELSKYVEEAEARYICQKRIYPSVFSNRLVTDKLLQKCSKWGFQGELCIYLFWGKYSWSCFCAGAAILEQYNLSIFLCSSVIWYLVLLYLIVQEILKTQGGSELLLL